MLSTTVGPISVYHTERFGSGGPVPGALGEVMDIVM